MDSALNHFYLAKDEPLKGCLLALREVILSQDKEVTNSLKYGMPFFSYRGKMFCYLWVHKKYKQPYIGFVEGLRLNHPSLIIENRARMKIFLVDQHRDLPIKVIRMLLRQAIDLYKSGTIELT